MFVSIAIGASVGVWSICVHAFLIHLFLRLVFLSMLQHCLRRYSSLSGHAMSPCCPNISNSFSLYYTRRVPVALLTPFHYTTFY